MSDVAALPFRIVEKTIVDPGGCWLWMAATSRGCGITWDGRRTVRAHRFVWELLRGEIPEGLTIDHLCCNKRCINPAHLEPVTRAENTRRALASLGHPNSKKTLCRNGHPYSDSNTISRGGTRTCRICRQETLRRYREKSL